MNIYETEIACLLAAIAIIAIYAYISGGFSSLIAWLRGESERDYLRNEIERITRDRDEDKMRRDARWKALSSQRPQRADWIWLLVSAACTVAENGWFRVVPLLSLIGYAWVLLRRRTSNTNQ